ncbi:MAG: hypothetical protein AAF639_28690 [Chloroflexota bacterium]
MPKLIIRLAFFVVILLAIIFRLWQIDSIPPGFHFDESFEGLEAWRILTDSSYRPIYLTGNFGVPPLNAYANAMTFALIEFLGNPFGLQVGPVAMRVTAAFLGVLGIIAVYALAWELRWVARPRGEEPLLPDFLDPHFSILLPILAAAVLAMMRWHVHFSRMGIEPIFVPLVWAAVHWLFLHGFRTDNRLSFIGAGILLATGMYTYRGAWVIPLLMIPVGLHLLFYYGFTAKRIINVAITAIFAVLLFIPLGWTFWQQPSLLFLRLNQLNIIGETVSPADATILNNVWKMATMFGPSGLIDVPGDIDPRRNLPGAPALNIWFAIPFYLGLLLSLWRIRRPAYAILVIGLLGLLSPNLISEYAPHFHRVLGAAAPTALLCGLGLNAVWHWQSRTIRQELGDTGFVMGHQHTGIVGVVLCLALLTLGGITSAQNYFTRWANQPALYYAFDVGLWDIGQWIAAQPSNQPIYLTPRQADHPTLEFAYRTQGTHPGPTSFDGRHIFPVNMQPAQGSEYYISVEHEDFRTRLLLPEVFPEADIAHELLDDDGNLYARIYRREAEQTLQRQPSTPHVVALGDGINLMGFDVQQVNFESKTVFYVQLHWSTTTQPQADWTVYTHLIRQVEDDGGQEVVAGHDSPPGAGSLPTTHWQANWRVLDEYEIHLPAELEYGVYGLEVGLYKADGTQLPASGDGVFLGNIEYTANP